MRKGVNITSDIECLYMDPWDSKKDLEVKIRALHDNLYPDREFVTGLGSTQVTIGLMYALYLYLGKKPSYYEKSPFYLNRRPTVDISGYNWSPNPDIEFVTSPNNPDGSIRFPSTNAKIILWDAVYAWPYFGFNRQLITKEMMKACEGRLLIPIYSFSKLLGLAGQRLGYAFIPPFLLEGYNKYAYLSSMGLSKSGYTTCLAIASIPGIFDTASNDIRIELERRHDHMISFLEPQMDGLEIKSPRGFPYLWIYMKGSHAYDRLMAIGIRGIAGSDFGASDEYARLNLMAKVIP